MKTPKAGGIERRKEEAEKVDRKKSGRLPGEKSHALKVGSILFSSVDGQKVSAAGWKIENVESSVVKQVRNCESDCVE